MTRLVDRLWHRFRLRSRRKSAPPAAVDGVRDRPDRPVPLVPMRESRGVRPVTLAVAWGFAGGELVRLVETVAARDDLPAIPLVLVDTPDFEPLRRHRLPFEYLPFDTLADWPGDAESYLVRRFELYLAKYRPAAVVAFGAEAKRRLRMIAGSPAAGRRLVAFLEAAGYGAERTG